MKKTLTCSLLLALALPVLMFADGAAIYKTRCAPCHRPDGSGQTPVGKNLKVQDLRRATGNALITAHAGSDGRDTVHPASTFSSSLKSTGLSMYASKPASRAS